MHGKQITVHLCHRKCLARKVIIKLYPKYPRKSEKSEKKANLSVYCFKHKFLADVFLDVAHSLCVHNEFCSASMPLFFVAEKEKKKEINKPYCCVMKLTRNALSRFQMTIFELRFERRRSSRSLDANIRHIYHV